MKSETYSECEDVDDNQLVIDTSSAVLKVQTDYQNEEMTGLYSDSVIENLWQSKAMGNYGPEEILVSLWFYISHYFGLSSRIDHAKLCLGNILLETDGNQKRLVFEREFESKSTGKILFNTRFPPKPIYEIPGCKERCPIVIYDNYVNHRPLSFCYPSAPFYLQPDRSVNREQDGPWYAAAGLGKNRIGALFNAALTKCGQPTVRHHNCRRQLMNDNNNTISKPPSTAVTTPKIVESSPKIKLKISHLNSGNPVVTQTVFPEDEFHKEINTLPTTIEENMKTDSHKRPFYSEVNTKSTDISYLDTSLGNDDSDIPIKKEKFELCSAKFLAKPTKRCWTVQKSIINVTCKESNPIARQLMMHISMTKDPLVMLENKSARKSEKSRFLRSSVKLHQLQLPLWPTIEKFCDSELQRSMKYSFDDDLSVYEETS